ncbi:hypothetical protein Goklo_021593, partial [Gossypium klotzschianum]|nr:hypothetical protein [Gossypium klotzschianum]
MVRKVSESANHLFFKCKFIQATLIWSPPPHGCLKFNVCGIANEDRTSCGGVLRDKEGVARALFLGSIAANDSDLAKIGAVMI